MSGRDGRRAAVTIKSFRTDFGFLLGSIRFSGRLLLVKSCQKQSVVLGRFIDGSTARLLRT